MTSAIDPNIIVVGSPVSKSAMKTQLTTAANEITELQNRPGRRNRLINGAMQVDQRNNGASQTVTTGGAYLVDRWFVQPTGASVTAQRVAGPSGYQYTSQITGAASVTGIIFFQKIESVNAADLVSQNVTLSAVISNSLLTTVSWTANSANAVDNFSAVTTIASGSFTVTSTATQYTATFNAGANAANGISIVFSVGAQTSGTLKITGVQLESGSVLSTFERLSISETLMLCQRYFFKDATPGAVPYGATTPAVMTFTMSLPVTMRVSPTVAITTVPTLTNCTGYSAGANSPSSIAHSATMTGVAGQYGIGSNGFYTASAEL